MFYSNNHYMQDLYSYNQNPNTTYNNPYGMNATVGNVNNGNIDPMTNSMYYNDIATMNPTMNSGMNANVNPMYMSANPSTMMPNVNGAQTNLNNMYPSVYRIIHPVVGRVVAGNNSQFITEDMLDNMVETVYNIVEGQIEYEEDIESAPIAEQANDRMASSSNNSSSNTTITRNSVDTRNTTNNMSHTTSSNTNMSNNTRSMSTSNISTGNGGNMQSHKNDALLRDLIRILLIKEILSKQPLQQTYTMPMQNYYSPYYRNSCYQPY